MPNSYMDFSQMFGNQDQNRGGQSLYRPPQYVQVGNTQVRRPTVVDMSSLYQRQGGVPVSENITEPKVGQIDFGREGTRQTFQTTDLSGYLGENGWMKVTDPETGIDIGWFPADPPNGATYEYGDQMWYATNGDWKKAKWNPNTNQWEYPSLKALGFPTGVDYSETSFWADIQWDENIQGILRPAVDESLLNYLYGTGEDVIKQAYRDNPQQFIANLLELRYALRGNIDFARKHGMRIDPRWEQGISKINNQLNAFKQIVDPTYTAWQETYENLLGGLQTGDAEWINEAGAIDFDTLRQQGVTGQWLADTIQNAYDTGIFLGPLYDPETGEINEHLEGIVSNFDDEYIQPYFDTFMKDIRLAAAQRGHSVNDVSYLDAVEGWQSDIFTQVYQQVGQAIIGDVEAMYQNFTASLQEAMELVGESATSQALLAQLENRWATAYQNYEQAMQQLALEISQLESERAGDIFNGILGGIFSAIGSIFGS